MSDNVPRISRPVRERHTQEPRPVFTGGDSRTMGTIDRRLSSVFWGKDRLQDLEVEGQFGDVWVAVAILFALIGIVAQFDALLIVSSFLFVTVAFGWVWNRFIFVGLSYSRHFSVRRAFVGETVELQLSVTNRKYLPLSWLQIEDVFPHELPLEGGTITEKRSTNQAVFNTFWALKWHEKAIHTYRIHASQRGLFAYGPATLKSGDPFGLFHSTYKQRAEQWLIVYPQVVPLTSLGLPAKEPFGNLRAQRFMFKDPSRTVGVRDYQPEDDFRHLHWKATARRQKLQTRVLEPSNTHNLVVFLNVATLAQHWQGVLPDVLEQIISVAGSICYYGIEQRWPTGLIANGALPRSDQPIKVLPGRAPGQLTLILEMLAAVTPYATSPIEQLIAQESARLPWGSTLVVVSATLTDPLASTLLHLKEVGRRIALVSLDPAPLPDSLREILIYQVPRGTMHMLDLGHPVSGERAVLDPTQLQQHAIRDAATLARSPETS